MNRSSVPVRARVPRPPFPFVGRAPDVARLEEWLAAGPLAIVTGLPGLGKTALARSVAHGNEARAASAFHVAFAPSTSELDGLLALARALSIGPTEAQAVDVAPDLLFEAIFERVEELGAFVVLDDVHHWKDGAEDELEMVLQFAERSRWLVTSRLLPRSEALRRHTITLSPLDEEAATQLQRALRPAATPELLARLAAAAAGSPRALQAGPGKPPDVAGASPWSGLDASAVRACEMLVALGEGVPMADLARAAGIDAATESVLARSGLLTIDTAVELSPPVAAQITTTEQARLRKVHASTLVAALRRSETPSVRLAAVKIAIAERDDASVRALLDESASILVEAGHALALFDLLDGVTSRELREHRIVAAAETGTARALTWATAEDRPHGFTARHAWISTIAFTGAAERALEEALELRGLATPAEAPRAAALIGRIARVLGRADIGIEALVSAPRSEDASVRVPSDALLAVLYAAQGKRDHALACIQRVEDEIGLLAPSAQGFPRVLVGSAYYMLGYLSRALEVAEDAARRLPWLRATAWWRAHHTALALEAGDLDLVIERRMEEKAARESRDRPPLHAHLEGYALVRELRVAVTRGDGDAIVASLAAVRALEERSPNLEVSSWARAFVCQVAMVRGEKAAATGEEAHAGSSHPAHRLRDAFERRLARRWAIEVKPGETRDDDAIDVKIIQLLEEAERSMLGGDAPGADATAQTALRLAQQYGWTLLAADIVALRGDLAILLGRSAESHASELLRMLDTPRTRAEAELMRLASEPVLDLRACARLARESPSPIAMRRARALVFDEAPGDGIDALVVACLRARDRSAAEDTAAAPRGDVPVSRLALDDARRELVVGGGKRVSFARNEVLWKLVATLLEHDVCTKEQLVAAAWGTSYHPLRDDARLRVALARLRKQLATSGARASIVATTAGYRLFQREGAEAATG